MKEDLTRPGTAPQAPNGRTGTAWACPAAASPIQGLQWLRQRVLERLEALEALARRLEPAPGDAEVAEMEQALRQRLAEVEEARRRVHAEAERREREWEESLTQLEADRRLLAEAWERIERQRIERPGASDGHFRPHALVQGQPNGGPAVPLYTAAPAPTRSAVIDQDPSNPVARAILREFQALTRDVRSNAARHDGS